MEYKKEEMKMNIGSEESAYRTGVSDAIVLISRFISKHS
jgi:hypothetical protein